MGDLLLILILKGMAKKPCREHRDPCPGLGMLLTSLQGITVPGEQQSKEDAQTQQPVLYPSPKNLF